MPNFAENGFVDPYPHRDFDGACTGPCCFPEAYPKNPWSCEECKVSLREPGICKACWTSPKTPQTSTNPPAA